MATRRSPGALSLRISSHLPASENSKLVKPVRLAAGLARLATRWSPTGSDTPTNTIGMLLVCCCSARAAIVVFAKRTSGFKLINSAANCLSFQTIAGSPPNVNLNVPTLKPAQIAQSFAEGRDTRASLFYIGDSHEHAHARQAR